MHNYLCNTLCNIYIDFCVFCAIIQVRVEKEGGEKMPLYFKIDILLALKEHGYNTTRLRREKLLAEGVIQALRDSKPVSWANIARICDLLDCQPGDILEYEKEGENK